MILAATIPVWLGGMLLAWLIRLVIPASRFWSGAIGIALMVAIAASTYHYTSQFDDPATPQLDTQVSLAFAFLIYGAGGLCAFGLVVLNEQLRKSRERKANGD